LLLVDEGYNIWESRESMTPFVSLMTRLIFLSRKLGVELIASAQLSSSLDKRIRFLSEEWILAEKETLKDGMPNFLYHRWTVHAVSTDLQKIPTVEIGWVEAQLLFKCYKSTKVSASELDSTLAELNALFQPSGMEKANMPEEDIEGNYLMLKLTKFLAYRKNQSFTAADICDRVDFKDYNPTDITRALRLLYTKYKQVRPAERKRGQPAWETWP
jgi:hypothetical protein